MVPINGYWVKAWNGYLAHFWLDGNRTLCGKTHLSPHCPGLWHVSARSRCKRCQKKYNALLAAQEKGTSK